MNISFFLTTEQVKNKTKTVTRRLGWWNLKAGAVLTACEKCQGLKKGEKINRLCQIKVVDVSIERLNLITKEDVAREGFPDWEPQDFIDMFCKHNKCEPDTLVARIEFEYLPEVQHG
jgi:hypothetical protein